MTAEVRLTNKSHKNHLPDFLYIWSRRFTYICLRIARRVACGYFACQSLTASLPVNLPFYCLSVCLSVFAHKEVSMSIGPLRLSVLDDPVYLFVQSPHTDCLLSILHLYRILSSCLRSTLSLLLYLSTKEKRRKRVFGQKDHSSEKDPLMVLTNEKRGGLKVETFDRFRFKVFMIKF